MNKFNVSIVLQVESDSLIYVSLNPIMSLFIFTLSLTISSTYFESDITLWTRTVTVLPEIAFLFIVENKSVSGNHIHHNASLFTFIVDFLNSPIQ